MLYLDLKYLNCIIHRLDSCTKKKDNVWNMRCSFCGDSANKNKKRGYVYSYKNDLRYSCHNCGVSYSFYDFLNKIDPSLWNEYRIELFREKYGTAAHEKTQKEELTVPTHNVADQLEKRRTNESIFHSICTPLSELPDDNLAVAYCIKRKIPKIYYKHLYYIDDTIKLLKLVPDLSLKFGEPRLVLPFLDKDGMLVGLTCRSLSPKTNLRYLTVKISDTPQVFGLDRVDPTKKIYIVEGPIDSLFLPNAIAVTGTSFGKVESILRELNIASDQVVLIIDNQPRNKEVVAIQSKLIDKGYSVVVWDLDDSYGKDINSLITDSHLSHREVFQAIKRCTFRGLEARMKFNNWKKC